MVSPGLVCLETDSGSVPPLESTFLPRLLDSWPFVLLSHGLLLPRHLCTVLRLPSLRVRSSPGLAPALVSPLSPFLRRSQPVLRLQIPSRAVVAGLLGFTPELQTGLSTSDRAFPLECRVGISDVKSQTSEVSHSRHPLSPARKSASPTAFPVCAHGTSNLPGAQRRALGVTLDLPVS